MKKIENMEREKDHFERMSKDQKNLRLHIEEKYEKALSEFKSLTIEHQNCESKIVGITETEKYYESKTVTLVDKLEEMTSNYKTAYLNVECWMNKYESLLPQYNKMKEEYSSMVEKLKITNSQRNQHQEQLVIANEK